MMIIESLPLVQVDIGLLANQVGVPATNTLDLGQGVHDLLLSIDVGVEETENELEVRLFAGDESYMENACISEGSLTALTASVVDCTYT